MWPIIDANINRVCEGLRVIEEYTRFVVGQKHYTQSLKELRDLISKEMGKEDLNVSSDHPYIKGLSHRNTHTDTRAQEKPPQRQSIKDLLIANFKRVCQGLRVLEEYSANPSFCQYRYRVYELEHGIMLTLLKKPIQKGVYLISDQVSILEKGLSYPNVTMIQLRDKDCHKSEYLQKALTLKELSKNLEIPFIVNDYLDIALLINADGFHSGQDDIAIYHQRTLLGPHRIIGRSTHNLEQGLLAQKEGADYVSVGPIFETPSKKGRVGIGFDYLKQAHQLTIPYVAIGGIHHGNITDILKFSPPLIGVIRDYSQIPHYPKWE